MDKLLSWLGRILGLSNRLSPVWAQVLIAGLSVAVKLAYITTLGGGLSTFPTEGSDVVFYDGVARVLLQHGVYGYDPSRPTTAMPPGESAFLAFIYWSSGNSIAAAKLAHVALLTLSAVVIYRTGKLLIGPGVGFWAGALTAVDPAQAYLSGTFLSEPLFILSMVVGIHWLLLGLSERNGRAWLVASGLSFASAGLVRNQGWAFPIALLCGALLTRGRLMPIREAVLTLLVTAAAIAPWTYRNFALTGRLIPVSSEGGLTFWASNNPEFVTRPPMPMSLPIYRVPPGLSELETNDYYWRQAWTWIKENPVRFLANAARKLVALYHFDPLSWRAEVRWMFRLAGLFPYGLLIPFVFLGLLDQLRKPRLWPLLGYILYTTLLAMLFYGDSRIRAPIQPYLYLLGVAWLLHHWPVRQKGLSVRAIGALQVGRSESRADA